MATLNSDALAKVTNFHTLVNLLRDDLDWPIRDDMELDEVVFDWDAAELGLKTDEVAKIREIKQLRPLVTHQPWGVFFISFEDKALSVTVLRRLLRNLVRRKRDSAQSAERQAWHQNDLMFATNFGASGHRELAFIHFSDEGKTNDLPVMKVLGWNAHDTVLHNQYAANMLQQRLRWPDDDKDEDKWRGQWSGAFEVTHNQVINTSKDLAIRLAALAQEMRARANQLLKAETDKGPLRTMLTAFRKNLIQDLDEDGFADMFAQTIAYGLLAAHISRPSGGLVADNLVDMVPKTNPFLRELFGTFLSLGGRDKGKNLDFDELGVRDVVDMLAKANMEAVLRDFGDRNPKEDPVIHFYELFLKQYDPKKRMQRGVFYTPRPVVNFIVRGVDEILRTEFGLELGLADTTTWGELAKRNDKITIPTHINPKTPFVQILDPATGTGTFLVEVIDLIYGRMDSLWSKQGHALAAKKRLWNEYVPQHLLPRLTGFELLMAPYAIAHMKVGLKLSETGYTFGSDERARIFLTNALEPPRNLDLEFSFMSKALAHEAIAANNSKSSSTTTVVIGNPPYSNFGKMNKSAFISKLLDEYKVGLNEKKLNLDDDYIKFLRYSQSRLENTSLGCMGMITNNSFIDGVTHRRMRQSLLKTFATLRAINLHGSVRRAAEINSEFDDENVFDIQQGVSVLFAGTAIQKMEKRSLQVGSLVGPRELKFDALLNSSISSIASTVLISKEPLFLLCNRETTNDVEFQQFKNLTEYLPLGSTGIKTHHDVAFVSFSKLEGELAIDQLAKKSGLNVIDDRTSTLTKANLVKSALASKNYKYSKYFYRPFDERTVFYSRVAIPAGDHRYPTMQHFEIPNIGLTSVRQTSQGIFQHVLAFAGLADMCYLSTATKECCYCYPLWLKPSAGENSRRPNLNRVLAVEFGKSIDFIYDDGIPRGEQKSFGDDFRKSKPQQTSLLETTWEGRGDLKKSFGPRDLFDWIYAVLHAPSYRTRYAEFLKSDFPRIPTPGSRDLFAKLVALGRELVALHLLKADEASILNAPTITFHGTGEARVARGYPEYENGKVMINANRWFEDVPRATWEFHVGGYQVLEKWLKDRAEKGGKTPKPGRVLTDEDILHYRRVVVALTETRRIMAEIDKTIEAHGGWSGAFSAANKGDKKT